MRSSDIFALTPPISSARPQPTGPGRTGGRVPGVSLAVAACRAGARGFVDLEWARDPAVVRDALDQLERFTTAPYGVKLRAGDGPADLADEIRHRPPERLAWVLLAGGGYDRLADEVRPLREAGRQVYVEAVTLEEAQRAEAAGADGVVLKGQESGGRVGELTAFVLLQRWMAHAGRSGSKLPVWVQGGIGLNTAAACAAAGAAGVVLDSQLLLAKESPLGEAERQWLAAFDGSETLCLGEPLGETYRAFARPGWPASPPPQCEAEGKAAVHPLVEAAREEQRILASGLSPAEKRQAWRDTVAKLASAAGADRLWMLGQDAAFARALAERFGTVGGIIQAIVQRCAQQLAEARRLQPLAEGAPLAKRHRTRYPIVQGPMTRVSDTAPFAAAVADAGALPFLALALLRRAEAEALLKETKEKLGEKPWGVGILGFVPQEIRNEQLAAIRRYKPPFALIAGGRPDQARELERQGIPTYLHVPSPGLLRRFLKDGARRFVFEGRECGGHVGPRTSFVLWETMCEILLEHLNPRKGEGGGGGPELKGEDLHVVFAGGVHDGLSAAMVAALAAALAERGVAVGALMGTAYLFTKEAVESGAIVERFQKEALRCSETVLLQTAPGHAIRCIPTPYYEHFEAEKRRLQKEGKSHEEIAKALEWMNIGRLRVASKGVDRPPPPPRAAEGKAAGAVREAGGPPKLVNVGEDEQFARGMYMIGQVAGLRDRVVTMGELHRDVCEGGAERLRALRPRVEVVETPPAPAPCDIAVIGMACYYPRSSGLWAYWENILNKVNAVGEIPASHWDWRLYYDPDPRARDKIISKWGGFLDDIYFDPLVYGITPKSLHSIEPLQLYLLEAVRHAIADAGYTDRPFNRERTAAILGIGGGGSPTAVAYGFRTCLPMFDNVPGFPIKSSETMKFCESILPEWTEDSFPGILLNVAVGRVANRFNLGGPNYAIDAACGSSLAAVYACIRELEMGTSDVAVAMGADTVQTPYAYMAFSKTHALSPRGRCRPFDAGADGIALSEGIGAVVLKRLADAERDGDKIYAVIKGMGASSDGRDKGLTAPRAEGQVRALRRAYAQARVSPGRVGLVEAHGTGTVVGDQTEAQALGQFFAENGASPQSCALGSVKSMIGHSKCAAGIAGLIKAAMALHNKVLPPTLVETPNPKGNFDAGPLYLNTEPRPWVHAGAEPRVAGVSAFGFGGTNFHAVLEEYTGDCTGEPEPALRTWPAELFVWRRKDRAELLRSVEQVARALAAGARPNPGDLAAGLWKAAPGDASLPTLAVVAASLDDLREKLEAALKALRGAGADLHDPRGIYFAEAPARRGGKVAFLFPGQGSQYPDMLAQTAMAFPEVREAFEDAECALAGRLEKPLGRFVFPPSAFTPEQKEQAKAALTRTDVAQPAIGAASVGMFRLLSRLGLKPDFAAGHSYGELAALWAAGALGEADLFRLSHRRGQVIAEAAGKGAGTMAAVEAGAERVEGLIAGIEGVTVANRNSPQQTVLSGTEEAVEKALARCGEQKVRGRRIPVACAFHSPLVAAARGPLAEALRGTEFRAPRFPVFSNTTAKPHADDPAAVVELLADHLVSPVRFQEEVEAMYEAGARVFVEVGPQAVLTGLVSQTLAGRDVLAVASDVKGRPGLVQLAHLLGQLLARGVAVKLDRLYRGRGLKPVAPADLGPETGKPKLTPTTWVVNSVRNRPKDAPEPLLLGQSPPPDHPALKSNGKSPSPKAHGTAPMTHTEPTPSNGAAAPPAPAAPSPVPPTPRAGEVGANGSAHYHAAAAPAADEAGQVMLRFQDLMAKFLETQKAVMTTYLQGGAAPPDAAPPPAEFAPAPPRNGHSHAPEVPPAPAPEAPPPAPSANGDGRPDAPAANGEPAAAAQQQAKPDRDWFAARLQDLVSTRTGYPKEMLGLDLDLEADLGIDSIKRVEILGELAEMVEGAGTGGLGSNLEMEKLTSIKTLRGILDYLEEALGGAAGESPAAGPSANGEPDDRPRELEVQRALVRLVDAPLPARASLTLASGAVLFTDDGRGVAREMADRLADLGQKAVFLRAGEPRPDDGAGDVFHADLTDPDAVAEVVRQVRQQCGPVGGLVHLLPLAEPPQGETPAQRMRREVRSLYLLARELGEDLNRAADEGGAVLLSATALGGGLGFGDGPLPESYFAGHGGVIGFTKCLASEWPKVLARVVDVNLDAASPSEIAGRLLGELADANGPAEVGYLGARRVTWEPAAAPLDPSAEPALEIAPGSTILITGGARGITAAVALELARRHQPNLILVGRSPLPEESEPDDVAGLTEPGAVKAALIERLKREGRPVAPAAVESAYQRLTRDREIRGNIERMRQAGARVHYYQADVRDAAAMGRLLDEVAQRFGGIDGVVHGAGVIEDKLVKDKTPESFDRVFGTKVESALILREKLDPARLKFFALFASIASRYGNKGQSDYAAANEVLSKLAHELDRRWPCRVFSVAWGPWSGVGMVADLAKHLVARGLKLITTEEGPVFFADEIARGRKGEREVIIAGGAEHVVQPVRSGGKPAAELVK